MNMDEYKTVKCGLVGGRHPLPVDQYIWDSAEMVGDPMNRSQLMNHIGLTMPKGVETIEVYITGMTPCLLALVNWCWTNGVTLVTYQWNMVKGEYVPNVEMRFDVCPFCGGRRDHGVWYCPHCGST